LVKNNNIFTVKPIEKKNLQGDEGRWGDDVSYNKGSDIIQ